MLNLIKGATQSELDEFFSVLHQQDEETRFVTASAFTQAREYLKHTAFEELNTEFNQQFNQLKSINLWRGLRVLAVDTTTLRLPESAVLTDYFGGQVNSDGLVTMARLSTCLDVSSGLTIDAQIAPYLSSERDLAAKHLAKTQLGDLLLYDRGYPAFWLFALHKSMDRDFCMRVSAVYSTKAGGFIDSDDFDARVEFKPNPSSKSQCVERDLPLEPITLRVLKIVLSTGETEILLTTLLDTKRYPYRDFCALYKRRWGIEVDYHFKKNTLEIESFTGLSVHAIQQDIAAKVLTHNIAMAAVCCAQKKVDKQYAYRKHKYKINVSHGLSAMKHLLVKVFARGQFQRLLEHYVELLVGSIGAIRPGRSFPRVIRKIRKKCFYTCLKRAR